MGDIARVTRMVYVPAPREGVAAVLSTKYTGRGLEREENLSYQSSSDWADTHQVRTSNDGGRSWSEWKLVRREWPMQGGFSKEEGENARCHDPVSGKLVRFFFQRVLIGKGPDALARSWKESEPTFFDHNFWQLSDDDGRIWGERQLLRYESGSDFNPDDWGEHDYLWGNRMYGSYGAVATREGTVIYPTAGVPLEIVDRGQKEMVNSVRCMIGRWEASEGSYDWQISDPISVPHRISGRGLLEPAIAQLIGGRLLLVMRGSNHVVEGDLWKGQVESPGRKWMSVSGDGGHTWTPVTDLRYDTGEQFYSPSTFALMRRHSRTGKLYWFGNISAAPPDGNSPRYPLYMAEVDESGPSLKKNTLTVIDNRGAGEPETLQLSNFSLFENPDTGDFELYLTRYGEKPGSFWEANAYKYILTMLG